MKKLLLLILIVNLAIVGFVWWHGSGSFLTNPFPGSISIAFGRLFGLLLEILLLMQLLYIGRISWLEKEFGHDKLNRVHRIMGYSIAGFLIAHPLFLSVGYATSGHVSVVSQFFDFLYTWPDVLKASLAVLLLAAIIITSIFLRKIINYEGWHFIHLFAYVALVFAISHQIKFGDFLGNYPAIGYWLLLFMIVVGLEVLYRFLRPLYLFSKHWFRIEKVERENSDINSVYISGRNMGGYNFMPGQFANLIFLDWRMWMPHPFSFAAAPDGRQIQFSIKNSGDFTSKIQQLRPGTFVVIDGPLGKFTPSKKPSAKYLFIAGGIGITPIKSLIESVAPQGKNAILLYSVKKQADAVFIKEFESMGITFHLIVTDEKHDLKDGHEHERVSAEMIKRLAPDFKTREIYLCGPEEMIDGVNKILRKNGVPKKQIHFEKFSY